MLSPHVPDLRALELLVVVARTGSVSSAAAELDVSQQAASSRLRTMESLVGAPLLSRTRRGSTLTPTGELVVQWATRVLDAAEELDTALGALRADRAGRLSIAASLTIAEYLLPGWLVALRAQAVARGRAPIEFTMTATNSDTVAALVADNQVDVGFVEGPTPPKGLSTTPVGVDELVVVVGPSHPWADRHRPVSAAVLASTPMVVREVGSGTRTVLEWALWQVRGDLPPPPPVLELSSTSAVRAAVAAGAGPAALSSYAVRDDIASGRLVRVPVTGIDLTRRLHAVWASGAHPPAGPARDLVSWAGRASDG